jgi:hypothetical protein
VISLDWEWILPLKWRGHGWLFVGAALVLVCETAPIQAGDALTSLTLRAVAREELPRDAMAWDEPSRHELYDFGDLTALMDRRPEPDPAYQAALDRAVDESQFSQLSATLDGDNEGASAKIETKMLRRSAGSPSRQQ